jgi:hypothetical protein
MVAVMRRIGLTRGDVFVAKASCVRDKPVRSRGGCIVVVICGGGGGVNKVQGREATASFDLTSTWVRAPCEMNTTIWFAISAKSTGFVHRVHSSRQNDDNIGTRANVGLCLHTIPEAQPGPSTLHFSPAIPLSSS